MVCCVVLTFADTNHFLGKKKVLSKDELLICNPDSDNYINMDLVCMYIFFFM